MKFKVFFILATIMAVIAYLYLGSSEHKKQQLQETVVVLEKIEPYSKYNFGHNLKSINIGTQPLYLPTGMFTEIMKRDEILKADLSKLSFNVNFFPFYKGSDLNYFLAKDSLQAGIGGDMPTISISAKYNVVVPAMLQHGFSSIVSNNHMLINQLKGKEIGYAFGSNAHYALLNALKSEKIDVSEVTLIPLNVNQMSKQLADKKIDAFAAWEPTPSLALKEDRTFTTIHKQISTGYFYLSQDFSINNVKVTKCLVASLLRAYNWLNEDRQNVVLSARWLKSEIEFFTKESFKLSENEIVKLAKKDILGFAGSQSLANDESIIKNQLFEEFEFLKQLNKIPAEISWERVLNSFNYSFISDIINESEDYQIYEYSYKIN
jgi:NitT/TauT family transport system substrate-binding protein